MENPEQNTERLQKAKEYEKIHNKLFVVDIILSLGILIIFAFSGLSKWLDARILQITPNVFLAITLYVTVCFIAYSIIFLPLSYYSGYMLEHKFDLSVETKRMWLWDYIKSFLINFIFLLIFAQVLHLFLRITAEYWWIWAGIFWLLFGILISNLFPILILPLFYKIKPLADQDLVGRLIRLSESVRAKVLGVFEMDMSRKSKKANAMFAGLGNTKRIILSDTLIRDYTHEEIEVVLAHELGHYYHRHIWKLIAISTVTTFAGLYITNILLGFLLGLGGYADITAIGALPLFALVLSVFALIFMPVSNTYSRVLENQADVFAIEKTKDPEAFISSMKKLASQNLANPDPNPVIEFILYSHPAISKRIKLAEEYIKQQG
ncbi:M48 family metallopeptidase [Candidatus Auribacterota bacterium]